MIHPSAGAVNGAAWLYQRTGSQLLLKTAAGEIQRLGNEGSAQFVISEKPQLYGHGR
jgi:hypothetical protein